jgi:hypothetical protein
MDAAAIVQVSQWDGMARELTAGANARCYKALQIPHGATPWIL